MPFRNARCVAAALAFALGGCASTGSPPTAPPPLAEFCREAERIVVHTEIPVTLTVHTDFDAFVKSKTAIEPLTIHEYIWYEDENKVRPVMISCKLKGADHLNATFGPGTAGPQGLCQDMNRRTLERVRAGLGRRGQQAVVLDPVESIFNDKAPGLAGPDWLKPYTLAYRDDAGVLHIRSKAFRVDWNDPRFAELPGKFRGVQYCHFIAPEYLGRLLTGDASPGLAVGRVVQAQGPSAGTGPVAPAAPPAPAPSR